MREQAIREMEKKIEQDVNRRCQSPVHAEPQVVVVDRWSSMERAVERPERLEPRIAPEVPVSSLEISDAADAISGQEVAEAVVELHMSHVAKGDAKSGARGSTGPCSLVDARRALIHSLGFKAPAADADSQARLCKPQPDPSSPMTPLPDALSPVSRFLARMAFEQASTLKPQQVTAEPTPTCQRETDVKHTELCDDLMAQSSLEYAPGAQYRASSVGTAGRYVIA